MLKHKVVTKSGGITLPKDIRHTAGILPGTAVDIIDTGDGVVIKKHTPACHICGNTNHVVSYLSLELCADCLRDMQKKLWEQEAQKNA